MDNYSESDDGDSDSSYDGKNILIDICLSRLYLTHVVCFHMSLDCVNLKSSSVILNFYRAIYDAWKH